MSSRRSIAGGSEGAAPARGEKSSNANEEIIRATTNARAAGPGGVPRYTDADLEPVRLALTALSDGNFHARRLPPVSPNVGGGALAEISMLVDEVAGQLSLHASEVTQMAAQVRDIARVATAVAKGDLSQKITVDAQGEMLQLKQTVNTMVDQLSAFADEVTRVAREVGTEGNLGGQAHVRGASGVWKDLTDSVNGMAANLTVQVRGIAQVTTAVAKGDLSQKITVDAQGEVLRLKDTINVMVDQLSAFADEVTRVAREVGTEGNLGGQARVRGASGVWKDLTDSVNGMAANLTVQVRGIAQVATAVANGDLSKKITVDAQGEVLQLKDTINTMVDQLSAFADEVTRMAREVGTEGRLGGQAKVRGVSGTWKDLTDNVNFMANNLTSQVRGIAQVATAVANGDLSKKITVDARGEILELKTTINTMVDQLSAFADEVTRVAREVGSEGRLGGQAEVRDISGTWKSLTDSVNKLAGNLTAQVRAIAAVASAVAEGDLTQSIQVDARGEVAELKDNINLMVANLRETTTANQEQDWLKTNLARIAGLMQSHRELLELAKLIMSELTSLTSAQFGAFYLAEYPPGIDGHREQPTLKRIAGYGLRRKGVGEFTFGEGLVGQAAVEGKPILITKAPRGYITVGSGLGEASPASIVILPIVFEEQVLGVLELASLGEFSDAHMAFFDQFVGTIGVTINTIMANSRTEVLLARSQRLTQELQERSDELQRQQAELRRSNAELEEKAALLAKQNRAIEVQNFQIEQARRALEERAQQLALSSRYKSEFLANMSHELRTPLNSLLVLAKLLSENPDGNLTLKQVEFARTIHEAGSDLLQLINDILDLSKVEAGKMDVHPQVLAMATLVEYVEAAFRPVVVDKGLGFRVEVTPGVPEQLYTDEQRLQQVLRNLLSNAVKFTAAGDVRLRISRAKDVTFTGTLAEEPDVVAFAVSDTGTGIAEDKLRVIFDAFQQADGTTSRRYGGTGLGLSISKDIARLLGGEIRAHSRVGQGSTFTLYLPVRYAGALAPPGGWRAPDYRATGGASRETQRGDPPDAAAGTPPMEHDVPRGHAEMQGPSGRQRAAGAVAPDRAKRGAARRAEPAEAGPALAAHRDTATAGARRSGDGHAWGEHSAESRAGGARAETAANRGSRQGAAARPSEPALFGEPGPDEVLNGTKILIIDDDVRNVFALTSVFERCGAHVLYAENGREGIDVLEHNEDVRLVLMDVMMPELDGYATTEAVRRMPQFADLPIIALTAKAMKGDREKSIGAGASDYIPKPVDVEHLLLVMRQWLERAAAP
jgi:signal transduction histidine kinase/HAMP domain-containing protein/ActR/RegA family two-component response regulator